MVGRLRCRRPPMKPSWCPDHETCTTTGHVVNVFDPDLNKPLLQVLAGTMDISCVDALVDAMKETARGRGNDYGLGVLVPRDAPLFLRVQGRPLEIPKGSYAVINPTEMVMPEKGRVYSLTSVAVFQAFLRESREVVGLPQSAGPFDFQGGARVLSPAIREAIGEVQRFAEAPAGGAEERWLPLLMAGAVWKLMAVLWREHPCGLLARANRVGFRRTLAPPLQRAVEYINLHVAKAVPNGKVADHAGVSVQHLIEIFHRQFGYSPQEYVRRLRLDQAKRLKSQYPRMSWQEIAEKVGFAKAWSLTRLMKTPIEHV